MTTFSITDDFYLDQVPFKFISGSIHYFRVVPEYWRDRLEKLRLMGCNTVETYVPWNMHEPQEGEYCFKGGLDLRRFIQTAQEVGLYVILRPAPYICAEWEFGGLPYWLLQDPNMKLRFDYPPFMEKVEQYFDHLFPQINDLQYTQGGPILMMQVENEYGGYANDKSYLKKMAAAMRSAGAQTPFVTSDGPWHDMLENGSMQELALATINCGSKIKEHFERLRSFHGEKKPLMVMEFWIGWFDAWGDDHHHTTSSEDAVKELTDCLAEGSVNIYMFHGGTNFGFMNGANYYQQLAPDVTSYDYDALLTEWGEPTEKYQAFRDVIGQFVELPDFPLSTKIKRKGYGAVAVQERVSLFATIDCISQPVESNYPLSMEQVDQATGYIYYRSNIGSARKIEDYRLINCMDRAHTFINNRLIRIDYDHDLGKNNPIELTAAENELGILVENMGRVNYSVHMNHQYKGIKDGVIVNGAFQSEWLIYPLPMDNLAAIDFSGEWQSGQPSFSRFSLMIDEPADTFIELPAWGKGFVSVNGHNIGRFWQKGPQKRLYIPAPFLHVGTNEIIVFESDGIVGEEIIFHEQADLGPNQ